MNRFLNILKFQVNKINELLDSYIKNVMVSKKNVLKKKSKVLKKILKILKKFLCFLYKSFWFYIKVLTTFSGCKHEYFSNSVQLKDKKKSIDIIEKLNK